MYQSIEIDGKPVKVMTVQQAARRLACVVNAVRNNLKAGRLEGVMVFDKKANRNRQYVFVDSILKFKAPAAGRKKGSKDKTTDRTARQKAAKENGKLGGLANRGISKTKRQKEKA